MFCFFARQLPIFWIFFWYQKSKKVSKSKTNLKNFVKKKLESQKFLNICFIGPKIHHGNICALVFTDPPKITSVSFRFSHFFHFDSKKYQNRKKCFTGFGKNIKSPNEFPTTDFECCIAKLQFYDEKSTK